MGKNIEVVDVIVAPGRTQSIEARSKVKYATPYLAADMELDTAVPYRVLLELIGAAPSGGTRVSIPSAEYPDATITDDGFSVTVTFGSDLADLLDGFEPVAFLINDGLVSGVAPRYIYTSGAVTGMFWDGGYVPFAVRKVNFVA